MFDNIKKVFLHTGFLNLTEVCSSSIGGKYSPSGDIAHRLGFQGLQRHLCLSSRTSRDFMDHYGHIGVPCHGFRHGDRRTRHYESTTS
jgi:hypothetical protein